MRFTVHHDLYLGMMIGLVSVGMFLLSMNFPGETARFPKVILLVFGLFGVWIMYKGIIKTRLLSQGREDKVPDKPLRLSGMAKPFLCLLSVMVYAGWINILGFFTSTTVFLAAFMYLAKVKDVKKIVLITAGMNLFLYIVFVRQLHVQLPAGLLR